MHIDLRSIAVHIQIDPLRSISVYIQIDPISISVHVQIDLRLIQLTSMNGPSPQHGSISDLLYVMIWKLLLV